MATSAKSVTDFFNEESFFDSYEGADEDSAQFSRQDSASSLLYSPLSVESVSLSPSETPSPDGPTSVPEKRRSEDANNKRPGTSRQSSSLPSKVVKSEGAVSASANVTGGANSKKPGRKLDPTEPENKRKAQNRAAQRAFRERKEKHLKELEDKVSQLESEAAATSSENEFLRHQVERLQNELRRYRQQNRGRPAEGEAKSNSTILVNHDLGPTATVNKFTFEFPFFSDSAKSKAKSVASPASSVKIGNSPAGSVLSPQSSSSTKTSPNDGSGITPMSVSTASPEDHRISDANPSEFCDQLSLACGTKENPVPKATSAKNSPVVITAGSIPWTSSASPANNIFGGTNAPSTVNNSRTPSTSASGGLFSPSDFDVDFISEYRDPLFDGEQFTLPELATSEYSMFDPLENPIANTTFDMLNKNPVANTESTAGVSKKDELGVASTAASGAGHSATGDDGETVPAYPSKLMSCTAVWDRICQHPKFGDIDIDGLCHELRAKAKCSDSGVLLTEKDVDKVLQAFS